jgi:tetratricopeptide (TPR) repeat protein
MKTPAAAWPVSRSLLASGVLSVLTACALGPLQPDRTARAPDLKGFGDVQVPITTGVPAAQRWYTQGVLQAYAFNEREAVRMFKAGLAQDPDCAMCAWGVAWQLGPNINDTDRDNVPEAMRYLDHALARADRATPRERELMAALALRYGHGSQAREAREMAPLLADRCGAKGDDNEKANPLDLAYAERLRTLVAAAPTDPELLSLWAEAEMVATRADWWDEKTGQAAGRIGDVAAALEMGLALQPGHIGLNHYLIHAVDARGVAQRAEGAADRLGGLAPASPHLVHMPSHTYGRIGRYADAARVNETALAAEVALMAEQKVQGFDNTKDWRNHNQHFLWFAALQEGRGDAAVQSAREIAGRAAKSTHIHGEYRRSLVLLALLRLQRWDAVLAEPAPESRLGLAQALGEQARGVAYARTGRLPEARAALAKAEAGAATVAGAHRDTTGSDRLLRELAESATARLRAEIASAEGHHGEALKLQEQAVAASQRADREEPPMLAAGARVALGDLQLRAGQPAQAEQTFREDLALLPDNGWALSGLAQALRAQGKPADADALKPQIQRAWAQADGALRTAR